MIWHYTSMSVLQELMKPESKLYATHTSFVNDTQECILAAKASGIYVTLLCNLWRGALEIPSEEVVKDIDGGEQAPRFITCFSKNGDRLSQWRGYAPENGCSIGIDFDELRKSLSPSLYYPSKIELADCVYKSAQELKEQKEGFLAEANRIHKMSNTIIDTFFKDKKGQCSVKEREEKQKLCKEIELEIDNAAGRAFESMFWKHQAFSEEEEVRLALLYDGGLPARDIEVIGGVPRVGVRLKIPICSLIREVIIGPGPDMECNAIVARALCLKYGLKICIRKSEIPFTGVFKK